MTRYIIEWEGPGQYAPVVYRRQRYDLVVLTLVFSAGVFGDTVRLISTAQAARLGKVKVVA